MIAPFDTEVACGGIKMGDLVQGISEHEITSSLFWESAILAHFVSGGGFGLLIDATCYGSFDIIPATPCVVLSPDRQ